MDEVLGYISNLDEIDKKWLTTTFESFRRLSEVINDEELKVALVVSLPEIRIESQTERGKENLRVGQDNAHRKCSKKAQKIRMNS